MAADRRRGAHRAASPAGAGMSGSPPKSSPAAVRVAPGSARHLHARIGAAGAIRPAAGIANSRQTRAKPVGMAPRLRIRSCLAAAAAVPRARIPAIRTSRSMAALPALWMRRLCPGARCAARCSIRKAVMPGGSRQAPRHPAQSPAARADGFRRHRPRWSSGRPHGRPAATAMPRGPRHRRSPPGRGRGVIAARRDGGLLPLADHRAVEAAGVAGTRMRTSPAPAPAPGTGSVCCVSTTISSRPPQASGRSGSRTSGARVSCGG